jgi:hypothetical protein
MLWIYPVLMIIAVIVIYSIAIWYSNKHPL